MVSSGKPGVSEFRWRAKDGQLLWIETHLNPIIDENGQTVGLRGVSLDITSRKRVEAALIRNEAELNGIVESALDGIVMLDETKQIILFNSAAERIFRSS